MPGSVSSSGRAESVPEVGEVCEWPLALSLQRNDQNQKMFYSTPPVPDALKGEQPKVAAWYWNQVYGEYFGETGEETFDLFIRGTALETETFVSMQANTPGKQCMALVKSKSGEALFNGAAADLIPFVKKKLDFQAVLRIATVALYTTPQSYHDEELQKLNSRIADYIKRVNLSYAFDKFRRCLDAYNGNVEKLQVRERDLNSLAVIRSDPQHVESIHRHPAGHFLLVKTFVLTVSGRPEPRPLPQAAAALHYAVIGDKAGVVRYLLTRGANRNQRAANGATALEMARANGCRRVLQIFDQLGTRDPQKPLKAGEASPPGKRGEAGKDEGNSPLWGGSYSTRNKGSKWRHHLLERVSTGETSFRVATPSPRLDSGGASPPVSGASPSLALSPNAPSPSLSHSRTTPIIHQTSPYSQRSPLPRSTNWSNTSASPGQRSLPSPAPSPPHVPASGSPLSSPAMSSPPSYAAPSPSASVRERLGQVLGGTGSPPQSQPRTAQGDFVGGCGPLRRGLGSDSHTADGALETQSNSSSSMSPAAPSVLPVYVPILDRFDTGTKPLEKLGEPAQSKAPSRGCGSPMAGGASPTFSHH